MTTEMYTIFDSEAQIYQLPFYEINDGTAIRKLQQFATKSPEDVMVRYPEQFTLFHIGTYDDSTGSLHPVDPSVIMQMDKIITKEN